MNNILLGLMTHACLHPCSWCQIHRNDLKNESNLRTTGSLKTQFWDLYDNYPPKIHAVMYHVKEYCLKQNSSLGPVSEQASESVSRTSRLL